MPDLLVEMKDIVKRFPGVLALDRVDFELRPGEVHVLLGENGAGKSTLIKVLSGAHTADEGEVKIAGQPVQITSPRVPLERGVRFIYQEINLVGEIDIARNIFLGSEPTNRLGLVDHRALYASAEALLKRFQIYLSPRTIVSQLSPTQQKMVEIARAMATDAKVLVLDEPTDVLADESRHELFAMIERLKAQGVGFIYISHRYSEVYEIGDRVTILRDGRNAGVYDIEELTLDTMIELMVGGQVQQQYPELMPPADKVALSVNGLSQAPKLKDISFELRQGEVLGVTGLMGAGKTELGRALAGCDPFDGGQVTLRGQPIQLKSVKEGVRRGIAYLTEDRKTKGLILDQSLKNNYALPSIDRLSGPGLGVLKQKQIDREMGGYMTELSVKAPTTQVHAGTLSGGNQQKIVLAKWLGADCSVLVVDEPTRGIDIGGRAEVYRILHELLAKGVAILMLTSDYTEALAMSHRVMVLRDGRVAQVFDRGQATEEDIFRTAIGGSGTPGIPQEPA